MKKLLCGISFVLIIVLGSMGCSSKTESVEVLNKYFDNLKNNKLEQNYDYLSSGSQNIWSKEKYNKWESMHLEAFTLKDVRIEKSNEYSDKDLDGETYKNIVEYNITEIEHDNFNNKDVNSNYVLYAVNENQKWKIYRGKEEPDEKISEVSFVLASMYFRGRGGKNIDLEKSKNILNEAIKADSGYTANYNLLSYVYIGLKKYDDAIDIEQQYLSKVKNETEKADGYNALGQAYKGKKDYIKAKESYIEAIKANPDYGVSYNLLGYTYLEMQSYDDAINIVQQYLTKAKDNQEKAEGYNVLGLAYEGKNDNIKAKDCYNKAIEADPNNKDAKINLKKLA